MGLGADAAVDAAFTVYGLRNLRAADASVMPQIT
ncbi:GMC oxidoreductase [Actimicrobium sp. GrIS 1.19]